MYTKTQDNPHYPIASPSFVHPTHSLQSLHPELVTHLRGSMQTHPATSTGKRETSPPHTVNRSLVPCHTSANKADADSLAIRPMTRSSRHHLLACVPPANEKVHAVDHPWQGCKGGMGACKLHAPLSLLPCRCFPLYCTTKTHSFMNTRKKVYALCFPPCHDAHS